MKKSGDCCFLIVIKELESPQKIDISPDPGTKPAKGKGKYTQIQDSPEIQRLEQELSYTKEHLQSIIEEQESTNEELKSANEEIQSSNEELQSTNEELETSKEELQSTNEELNTVNEELRNRGEELSRINNDLNNFITSTNLALVMLTHDLKVRRFTPQAQKLFLLIPADVGRPIRNITTNFSLPELETICLRVIDTLQPEEKEIQISDGAWYRIQIRPYRTDDNKIEGIVLACADIDQLRKNEELVRQSRDSIEATLQTVHEPLLELDEKLCVIRANSSFYQNFQVSEKDTVGVSVYNIGNGQWNIAQLRQQLEKITADNRSFDGLLVEHEFEHIGKRIMLFNARQISQAGKNTKNILLGIEDITERKQVESEMLESRLAAQKASRVKSEFLANMSHEIRTPLTVIVGFARFLADVSLSESERQESIERIEVNAKQLNTLIGDILDLSRVEAGKLETHMENCDTKVVLADILSVFGPLAADKGLHFDVLATSPVPQYFVSDGVRIHQVLSNIVGNAIKFTEKGSVQVLVEMVQSYTFDSQNHLAFVVKDTGCGLTEKAQQGRLFDPFSQADSSVSRKYGGTGLGLSLSRRLARALGGDVVLTESTAGKGSVFTMTVDPGPLQDVPFLESLGKYDLHTPHKTVDLRLNNDLLGSKVLLVDDCRDIQVLVSRVLEKRGAQVDVASSAMEGIKRVRTGS